MFSRSCLVVDGVGLIVSGCATENDGGHRAPISIDHSKQQAWHKVTLPAFRRLDRIKLPGLDPHPLQIDNCSVDSGQVAPILAIKVWTPTSPSSLLGPTAQGRVKRDFDKVLRQLGFIVRPGNPQNYDPPFRIVGVTVKSGVKPPVWFAVFVSNRGVTFALDKPLPNYCVAE